MGCPTKDSTLDKNRDLAVDLADFKSPDCLINSWTVGLHTVTKYSIIVAVAMDRNSRSRICIAVVSLCSLVDGGRRYVAGVLVVVSSRLHSVLMSLLFGHETEDIGSGSTIHYYSVLL